MQFRKLMGVVVSSSMLAACGGSSGGDESPATELPPPNNAPTLTVASTSVEEGNTVEVEASASDSDGSIASYEWTQVSGPAVEFENGNATITFTAPAVKEDTELTFTVVVTDDDGDTAEETVTVTITANMREMSVSGKVTDGPIADANIEVVINGQRFTTTADANGDYTIDIQADDSFDQDLVTVVATGPGENSPVKLVSYLDSLTNLMNAAGEDGTLTKDDLFSVNVTNVTTAQAALMKQAIGGEITDVEAYEKALKEYDDSLLIAYSTAIKLVIDYANDNPGLALPEELSDTLALVEDPQAAANYINNAKETAPEIVEQAETEIFADPELVSAGSDNFPIADTYYIVLPDGQFGQARIVLKEDGTGSYLTHNIDAALSWTDTEAGVSITFADTAIATTSFWYQPMAKYVTENTVYNSASIKWLKQTEKSDTLVWSVNSEVVYPGGEFDNEVYESESVIKTVKTAGVIDAKSELSLGTYFIEFNNQEAVTIRDGWCYTCSYDITANFGLAEVELFGTVEEGGAANVSIFKVDGFGDIYTQDLSASWSVTDKGLVNVVTTTDEYSFNVAILESDQEGVAVVSNKYQLNQGDKVGGITSTSLEEASMVAWTTTNAPGIYSLGWDHFAPNEHFWVEVNADGTASTVNISDSDANGTIEADEISVQPGYWQIQQGGDQLTIRRYQSSSDLTDCDPGMFDPAIDGGCRLSHERTFSSPVMVTNAKGETEVHVAHLHRFYNDPYIPYQDWEGPAERNLNWTSFDNRRYIKLSEQPVDINAILTKGGTLTSTGLSVHEAKSPAATDAANNVKAELQREASFR